jgi:predicted transcriptional regulator
MWPIFNSEFFKLLKDTLRKNTEISFCITHVVFHFCRCAYGIKISPHSVTSTDVLLYAAR